MPVEAINSFLQLQGRELEIRQAELSRGTKQDEYNYELAKASIAAQSQDISGEREHQVRIMNLLTWRWGGGLALLAVVVIALVVANQAELAKTIVTHLGAGVAGAWGGFHFGKNKGRFESSDLED